MKSSSTSAKNSLPLREQNHETLRHDMTGGGAQRPWVRGGAASQSAIVASAPRGFLHIAWREI
eukprot:scaffold20097_cov63-Phaeocystis_antarctica.AAC.1